MKTRRMITIRWAFSYISYFIIIVIKLALLWIYSQHFAQILNVIQDELINDLFRHAPWFNFFRSYICLGINACFCILISAPAAGGPGSQLAAGAAAVPGQIGLLPPQQPTIGQQQLELPSKFDLSSMMNWSVVANERGVSELWFHLSRKTRFYLSLAYTLLLVRASIRFVYMYRLHVFFWSSFSFHMPPKAKPRSRRTTYRSASKSFSNIYAPWIRTSLRSQHSAG